MSGTLGPDVYATLTLAPDTAGLGPVDVGQTTALIATFFRRDRTPVTPTGVDFEVWGPNLKALDVVWAQEGLNTWRCLVPCDVPGRMRAWVRHVGPVPGSKQLNWTVRGTGAPSPDAVAIGQAVIATQLRLAEAARKEVQDFSAGLAVTVRGYVKTDVEELATSIVEEVGGARIPPAVAAAVLAQVPPAVAAAVLAQVSPAVAAAVLAQVAPAVAAAVLAQVEPAVAAAVLAQVPPAVAAAVLAQVSPAVAAAVLAQVAPAVAAQITAQIAPQVAIATTRATDADNSAKAAAAIATALPASIPVMVGHVYSFRIGRYYQEWGAQRAVVPQALADLLAVSRASVGGYFDAAGVYQQAANNVPRIGYNPTTLAPRGLMLSEARTNACTNSIGTGAANGTWPTGWGPTAVATGLTFACLGPVTEIGLPGFDFRVSGTISAAGGGRLNIPLGAFSIPAGGKAVTSFYSKIVSGTGPLAGGAIRSTAANPSVVDLGLTTTLALKEVVNTFTNATTATTHALTFTWPAGDVDCVIRVLAMGFEANVSVASSPILQPTGTTGAVTRLADATLVPDLTRIGFNNGGHSFAARFRLGALPPAGAVAGIWRADDGTDAERFRALINPDGTVTVGVAIGGVVTQITPTGTVAADTEIRLAAGFGLNGLKASLNGGPVTAGAPTGRPYAMSRLRLGSADLGGATSMLNGGLLDFAGRQGLLSDADLQGLLA